MIKIENILNINSDIIAVTANPSLRVCSGILGIIYKVAGLA